MVRYSVPPASTQMLELMPTVKLAPIILNEALPFCMPALPICMFSYRFSPRVTWTVPWKKLTVASAPPDLPREPPLHAELPVPQSTSRGSLVASGMMLPPLMMSSLVSMGVPNSTVPAVRFTPPTVPEHCVS